MEHERTAPVQKPRAESGEARVHVVKKGETLSEIAKDFFGDEARWTVIARANDIDDPSKLEVGTRLTIPSEAEDRSKDRERLNTVSTRANAEANAGVRWSIRSPSREIGRVARDCDVAVSAVAGADGWRPVPGSPSRPRTWSSTNKPPAARARITASSVSEPSAHRARCIGSIACRDSASGAPRWRSAG